jgi:hypothetical protein
MAIPEDLSLHRLAIVVVLTALFAAPAAAAPLIPVSTASHFAGERDDIVQVKKKYKAVPYGWSRGRKVGWRGRGLPPGQAKKIY